MDEGIIYKKSGRNVDNLGKGLEDATGVGGTMEWEGIWKREVLTAICCYGRRTVRIGKDGAG